MPIIVGEELRSSNTVVIDSVPKNKKTNGKPQQSSHRGCIKAALAPTRTLQCTEENVRWFCESFCSCQYIGASQAQKPNSSTIQKPNTSTIQKVVCSSHALADEHHHSYYIRSSIMAALHNYQCYHECCFYILQTYRQAYLNILRGLIRKNIN